MVHIQNLDYSVGDLQLLSDINWLIKPGRRIGLIGPNGAGKTTLFRLLTGAYQPDSGSINFPKGFSLGYLPQEEIIVEQKSVLQLVLQGHQELLDIEAEIDVIHLQLDSGAENESLVNKLGQLESRFSLLGGYQLESTAKKILMGLGFKETDFIRPIDEFSGGWRMRAHLARILLQQPQLLLLDEPTNHLDLQSLEWLEEYLQTFAGSIIIISHDRFFLDRIVTEIAELNKRKIKLYSGNFLFYEQKKELEQEQLVKAYEAQKAERERIQKFIDRFRYKNTKAAQVQSRVKMLEKMEKIDAPERAAQFGFRIQADVKSYNEVLTIEAMGFGYPDVPVFDKMDLQIIRGEKVALVGDNGQGKTTLTRLISNELQPQSGRLKVGERVNIGYYAQHQVDALNLEHTIYQEVEETAAVSFRTKLRDILGLFRFHGDDVNKKIAVLSGGEKARVSLAKILLSPCNFLIMDEPTNHLDIQSKEALEHALRDYDGTLIVISHDRYFLDRLVKRVVEIKDSKLYDYPGNYSYYLEKRKQYLNPETTAGDKKQETKSVAVPANASFKSKEQKRQEAEARQAVSKERNSLQKRIDEIETRLEKLTAAKESLEQQMADPQTYNDVQRAAKLNIEYKEIEIQLSYLEKEWEEKQMLLDELLERFKT